MGIEMKALQVYPTQWYQLLAYSFTPGSVHTARVRVRNPSTQSLAYSAELYLGKYEGDKAASKTQSFTLTAGQEKDVDFTVTMPAIAGTYHVYLDVYVAGELIAAYQATEDVSLTLAPSTYIFGCITDSTTGLAVPGVKVSLMDTSVVVYSNASGMYYIPDLIAGEIYGLVFEKNGYASHTLRWITPRVGENRIDVSLTPIPTGIPVEFLSVRPTEFSWNYLMDYCKTTGLLLGAVVPRCLYKPEAAGYYYLYRLYIKIPEGNQYFDPNYPLMSVMCSYWDHVVAKSIAALPPLSVPLPEPSDLIEPGIHDMPFLRPYLAQLIRFPNLLTVSTSIYDMDQLGAIITPPQRLSEPPVGLYGTYDLYLAMIQRLAIFGTDSYGHLEIYGGDWFRLIIKDLVIGTFHIP